MNTREEKYLVQAVGTVTKWSADASTNQISRMIILKSLAASLAQSSGNKQALKKAIDTTAITMVLGKSIAATVLRCGMQVKLADSGRVVTTHMLSLLTAFEAAHVAEAREQIRHDLSGNIVQLQQIGDDLLAKGFHIGWRWRSFMADVFGAQDTKKQPAVKFSGLFTDGVTESYQGLSTFTDDREILRGYLTAVTRGQTDEFKLTYLRSLVAELGKSETATALLIAIRAVALDISGTSNLKTLCGVHVLINIAESTAVTDTDGQFDLSVAHGKLQEALVKSTSAGEFVILAQTMVEIVNEKGKAMGQWNIDSTLEAVSVICSRRSKIALTVTTPATYAWLCRLVDTIVKRHRLRLEGHMHLLVAALQSLLRSLIHGHSLSAGRDANKSARWAEHAKLFSRLLEVVCEPTAASVASRPHKKQTGAGAGAPGRLSSSTEAARHSVGMDMYLVLMAYVRLLSAQSVGRAVREALEPGLVFSVLGVTPEGTRLAMNDALDESGRAIFKDMFTRWRTFGVWKGV